MNAGQDTGLNGVGWISDYMAWNDADNWAFGSDRAAGVALAQDGIDFCGRFVHAYLGWAEECEQQKALSAPVAPLSLAYSADALDVAAAAEDLLWDAYMVAAHTDADCMPQLRRMIAVSACPTAVALAA